MLRIDGTCYDPSYGVTYIGLNTATIATTFRKEAVAGFWVKGAAGTMLFRETSQAAPSTDIAVSWAAIVLG